MFKGYLEFAGVEIGNAERVTRYVQNQAPQIPIRVADDLDVEDLHIALEDSQYESPLVDGAPWVDLNDSATHRFLGIYPIDIEGVTDSTRSAEVTESTLVGGSTGEARDATRPVRYTALLAAEDEAGMEAGMSWLRQVVKGDTCGECGSNDLRFFLDKPVACDPLWSSTWNWPRPAEMDDLGAISPTSSPLIYKFQSDETMPIAGRFAVDKTRAVGAKVRWGKLARLTDDELSSLGPIYLRRHNLIRNPSFMKSTKYWTAGMGSGGVATKMSRIATDGADGGAFLRVSSNVPVVTRLNYMPDPSFVQPDPTASGWRSNAIVQRNITNARAEFEQKQSGDTLYAEVSVLGPDGGADYLVPCKISMGVSLTSPGSLQIFSNLGDLVASQAIAGTGDIEQVQMTTALAAGYVVRVISAQSPVIHISEPMVEVAPGGTGFFSGSFTNSAGSKYDYLGTDSTSISRAVQGSASATSVSADPTTTGSYGPKAVQFKARAAAGATLQSQASNAVGGTVLGYREDVLTPEWQTYTMLLDETASVSLAFTADGDFDLDQVMAEEAAETLDYFDGDSASLYDAALYHQGFRDLGQGVIGGDPVHSHSWSGAVGESDSFETFASELFFEGEDADFRPFFEVLSGKIAHVGVIVAGRTFQSVGEQIDSVDRRFHRVNVVQGPTVVTELKPHQGVLRKIEILLNANDPFMYGNTKSLLDVDLTRFDDFTFMEPVTTYTNNYINPKGKGNSGLATVLGTGTMSTLTNPKLIVPGVAKPGDTIRRFTATATTAQSSTAFGIYLPNVPLTGVVNLNVSAIVRASRTRNVRMDVYFLNDANAQVGTMFSVAVRRLAKSTWGRLQAVIPKVKFPVGATQARVYVRGNDEISWPANDYLDYTGIMAINSSNRSFPFFDGDTPDSSKAYNSWTGAVNASPSIRTKTAPINYKSLIDPILAPIPDPPKPPSIPGNVLGYANWNRIAQGIPALDIAQTAETVPSFELITHSYASADAAILRDLRVRFYPNPFGYDPEEIDTDSYCGEFVISFLPVSTRLVVSGINQRAQAQVGEGPLLPADHLLFSTDGGPVVWPTLSCGIPYVVTVDTPYDVVGYKTPVASLAITGNRRE